MKKATHICFLAKKKQIFNSIINGRRGIDLSSLGCLFTNSRPRFITTEHQQFPLGISDCYVRRILNNSSYPVCIIPSSAIERYFIPCCSHQPPRSESFTFNINWCNVSSCLNYAVAIRRFTIENLFCGTSICITPKWRHQLSSIIKGKSFWCVLVYIY